VLAFFFTFSCVEIPKGIQPVKNFKLEKYLGTWYEIARLDHRFERGLENISASYSRLGIDGVRVLNKGFDTKKRKWKTAEGKAYFIGSSNEGSLKVSFFGPFYGGYHIIDLDEAYSRVMICGPNKEYLWILSREPTLALSELEILTKKAKKLGFDVDNLIYVDHEPKTPK